MKKTLSKKLTLYFMIFFIIASLPFGVFHAYIIEKKHFVRIQQLSRIGAKMASSILTDMLSNYVIMHDHDYIELDHLGFTTLYGNKIDISEEYFKKIGTGKFQRYYNGYDQHPDVIAIFTSIQEAFLDFENIGFAILIDKNGYVPIHNKKFAEQITGVFSYDIIFNREKRMWKEFAAENLQSTAREIIDNLYVYEQDTNYKLFVAKADVVIDGELLGHFLCAYDSKLAMETLVNVLGKIGVAIFVMGTFCSCTLPLLLKRFKTRYCG